MINKNKEILNYYGLEKQIPIYIEEMSELTKELCKRIRKGYFKEIIIRDLNRLEEEIKVLKKV